MKSKLNGRIGTVKTKDGKYTAYCRTKMKWDQKENTWKVIEAGDKNVNRGRAFSVVSYNTDFGQDSDTDAYEYVVLINGMRVENYSKHGSNNGWGTKKFVEDVNGRNGRYRLVNILVDNDAPLEEQSKIVAKYMEGLMKDEHCTRVNLLGISKGGRMASKALKYIEDKETAKRKLNAVAYSMPGKGTIFASPELLFKRLDNISGEIRESLVQKLLPYLETLKPEDSQEELEDGQEQEENDEKALLIDFLKRLYLKIISQSHMDYDISVGEDGVPETHRKPEFYDENFIKFDGAELEAIRQIGLTNITTTCSPKTLKRALATGNINAMLLYLSAKMIFEEPSDGMVSLKSASEVGELGKGNIKRVFIPNGHHSLGDDDYLINVVLDNVLTREKELDGDAR